jgi:hypothetical protein
MRSTSVLVVTAMLLCVTLLSVTTARADPSLRAASVVSQSIGVFFEFEGLPPQLTIDTMQREVQSIMGPAGLVFSWHPLGSPGSQSTFVDLVVVKFKGSCSGTLPPYMRNGPGAEPVPLASTPVSDGHVLHFSEVRCDELRHYLSGAATLLNEDGRSRLYGRALGRIVSHEMWHIFAETEKHASGGVAQAWHSREELVKPVFVFTPKEEKILHEYAMRALVPKVARPEPEAEVEAESDTSAVSGR